jgi:putative tryptophan/tyrosine transport system substrate-binding protein
MKRREFITLLGGAAVSWPLAARAQQPDRVRRIGILSAYAENDREVALRFAALGQGLAQLGWMEGRNIRFDYRWAAGDAVRMPNLCNRVGQPECGLAILQQHPDFGGTTPGDP